MLSSFKNTLTRMYNYDILFIQTEKGDLEWHTIKSTEKNIMKLINKKH